MLIVGVKFMCAWREQFVSYMDVSSRIKELEEKSASIFTNECNDNDNIAGHSGDPASDVSDSTDANSALFSQIANFQGR